MPKQGTEATGSLEISFNSSATEATARFQPGEGEPWSAEKLLLKMGETGIVEGFRPEEVKRAFEAAARKNAADSFVIARGDPPVEPQAERAHITEIEVPPALQDQAKLVIAAADPPTITIERTEKIKHEKTVTRKPKLPFLPAKEETVAVTEEKVHRDRVYVDPTVERTGYATEGQKIGMVEGKDDGQAGRTVTGELVPPRALADPFFYCGSGVERRRDELFATVEGFVRVGANWADVVPFEMHDWEVELSSDKATCYLSFDPGHAHAKPPSITEIQEAVEKLEYPLDRLLDQETIAELIRTAVARNEPLERHPLTESRDGSYELIVADDNLRASINLHKSMGTGRPINLKELGQTLKQSKLVKLNYKQIQDDVKTFYATTDVDLDDYLVAEGTAPVPGPDRTLDISVRFYEPEKTAELVTHLKETLASMPGISSTAEFPAEAIEDIAPVERDQRILTVSPPVPGQPGVDVYGQQTPGEAAPDPPMELLENVQQKGAVIISTVAGLLHRGWRDGTVLLRIVPHRDGTVEVEVTENSMAAMITLKPGFGTGRPVEWEAIEEAVKAAGVSSGARDELLHRAWDRVKAGQRVDKLIFARGRHVRENQSGNLELIVEIASGKDVTIRSDGSADFKNLDRITTVSAGTEIARVHPAGAETEEGWNVLGEKLQAEAGAAVEVDVGPNVEIRDEEGGAKLLVAATDGELIYANSRFEVQEGHVVDGDVDLHSGNVKFPGPVTVKGSVRSGFYVVAQGSIQVAETVESALLSADGDIVVNQGIKGAGKAVLRTKGSVGLTFAEQATILSVGNVQAKNSLVHCTVKSNGKVRMIGDKCRIVGGFVRAREGLETHDLGSDRGVKTIVEFGQNYLIADRIESEEREMEKLKKEIARIDLKMQGAERSGDKANLNAMHRRKLQLLKLLEKRGLRVFTYRERFEEHHESEVVVKGTLHPGVVIQTHGRTLEITSPKKNTILSFHPESGRIEERTPEKE